jgi:hypothetical protein
LRQGHVTIRSLAVALGAAVATLGGLSAAKAQTDGEIILVLPPYQNEVPFEILSHPDYRPPDESEGAPMTTARIPLGTINIGEMSPRNGSPCATVTLRISIYSPLGWFPPYRIRAWSLTAVDGTLGNLNTNDVGLGIIDIVARRPRVAALYDYDPTNVGKNVDDEPLFQGTIGSLAMGGQGTTLYNTRGFYFGDWNYFTLVFAVGPQFFTPDLSWSSDIELEITL